MELTPNAVDGMSQLPLELFIPIIFLSFDTPDLVLRRIRTEELRLVNRAWRDAIDSTPLFWACIPNVASSFPQTIPRWIQKSCEAPLHILSTGQNRPIEEFMQFTIPHRHRWRKLEIIKGQGHCISEYINGPAPMLKELILSDVSFPPNNPAFSEITPLLSSVDLSHVTIPENIQFLRNLKHLRLSRLGYYPPATASLGQLCGTLSACPDLEKLELDANYINRPMDQPAVLLSKLSSFLFRRGAGPSECTEAILSTIIAPRLVDFYLELDRNWVPPVLNVLSPLSTGHLHLGIHKRPHYLIGVSSRQFSLSTIVERGQLKWYPNVIIDLSSNAPMEVTLKLLQSFEMVAPRNAIVNILLIQPHSIHRIINYLKSTTESKDGELDHPIPRLNSVRLHLVRTSKTPYEDLLADLAQARPKIRRFKIHNFISQGDLGGRVSQWDPIVSKFTVLCDEEGRS